MTAADVGTAVSVGQIVGAHALRGWVRLRPYQTLTASLVAGGRVFLERDGVRREARVTHAAPHGQGLVLLGLEGVTDRTTAEALRGTTVLVPGEDLPPLGADEYWHHEVLGFTVETVAGEPIGTITATMHNGLHDVWEVRADGHEHLIPVVAEVVRAIDKEARRVRIEPLPGLLD